MCQMDEANHIHCAQYRFELLCTPFKDQNQRAAAYWPDEFDESEMDRLFFLFHIQEWEVEDTTSYIPLFMVEYYHGLLIECTPKFGQSEYRYSVFVSLSRGASSGASLRVDPGRCRKLKHSCLECEAGTEAGSSFHHPSPKGA